jgi:hypothetical protein
MPRRWRWHHDEGEGDEDEGDEEGDQDDDEEAPDDATTEVKHGKNLDGVIVGDQTSLEGAVRLAINHLDHKEGASFMTSGSLDSMFPDIFIDGVGDLLLPANSIVAQVRNNILVLTTLNHIFGIYALQQLISVSDTLPAKDKEEKVRTCYLIDGSGISINNQSFEAMVPELPFLVITCPARMHLYRFEG